MLHFIRNLFAKRPSVPRNVDETIFKLLHSPTAEVVFGESWFRTPEPVRRRLAEEWKELL